MSVEQNIQLVKDIYAAFSRGDVGYILDHVADNVHWHDHGPAEIGYWGVWTGRAGVAEFFKHLAEEVTPIAFDAQEFIASSDRVVALGYFEFKSIKTGRVHTAQWVMVWTIRDGLVTSFDGFEDTASTLGALR